MDVIKVDTQTLMNASNEFSQEGAQIASLTSEMLSLVRGLAAQWQGEAAGAFINRFGQLEDDIQRMSAKISEFVEDLASIAEVYNSYEQQSTDEALSLETDVIA